MTIAIEVEVWRGAILESRHRFEAAAADAEGRSHLGTGDPRFVASFRSAAKPFQLLGLVERGHAERWGFSDEELAVMAASHTGSAYHRRLVSGILEKIGLTERHLACGFHEPIDPEALAESRAHPGSRSPLFNNCSGKHAGMLALAVAEGWPAEGYERADHPVQGLALRMISEVCGLTTEEIVTGTDHCGVVAFGVPILAMARGYARLASAMATGPARERALSRIRTAMISHPKAVGGEGRLSTRLMEAMNGKVVAKTGAEGLECMGVQKTGVGVALKCVDGSARAVGPAAVALLEHLGVVTEAERERLADARRPVLRNHAGREVGWLAAVVRAPSPTA
jgi:L-asparaginase II